MKTNLILFALAVFILGACNVGVNKDLLSGLKISNTDLTYKEGYLSMDQAKLNTSEFPAGKVVYMFFDGIEGYKFVDDKAFLGASLIVTDESGNKIIEYADLFETYNESGVSAEDSRTVSISLTIGAPLAPETKYTWKSTIWDKNGTGKIEAEVEFVVK
jgi:hypothetical protein